MNIFNLQCEYIITYSKLLQYIKTSILFSVRSNSFVYYTMVFIRINIKLDYFILSSW